MRLGARKTVGLTLVEMLIVLAIVALMGAVAVPSFARLGLFSNNAPENSARDLYAMLRATKLYAVTYHVPAALAYTIAVKADNLRGNDKIDNDGDSEIDEPDEQRVRVLDGIMMVRRVDDPNRPLDYVPVQDREGQVRLMTGNTCILPQTLEAETEKFEAGFTAISIFRDPFDQSPDSVVKPRVDDVTGEVLSYKEANTFPAHVFLPSGIMQENVKARYKVKVGLLPDELATERFSLYTQDLDPGEPDGEPEKGPTGELNPDDPRFVQVELFATLGRVKITS